MLLKNQWFNKKIKEEIRKSLETNENKNITFQNLWDVAKAKRKVYSNTGLPQETRKISNKQPKSHLRELEKQIHPPSHLLFHGLNPHEVKSLSSSASPFSWLL